MTVVVVNVVVVNVVVVNIVVVNVVVEYRFTHSQTLYRSSP